jgi:hypothetical protein
VLFSNGELRAAHGALVATMAYSAHCEHPDRLTAFGTRPPRPCIAIIEIEPAPLPVEAVASWNMER